jgi:hypothetical protein
MCRISSAPAWWISIYRQIIHVALRDSVSLQATPFCDFAVTLTINGRLWLSHKETTEAEWSGCVRDLQLHGEEVAQSVYQFPGAK